MTDDAPAPGPGPDGARPDGARPDGPRSHDAPPHEARATGLPADVTPADVRPADSTPADDTPAAAPGTDHTPAHDTQARTAQARTTRADGAPADASAAAPPRPASAGDGLRFAFGTLTVLPVAVARWDRAAARGGMLCAPLAGLVVGLCAAALGGLLLAAGCGAQLAAVAAVATGAVLSRGLHLDGLADTADGLGSGRPPAAALAVLKRSDIGPFGVVTLLLVLAGQIAALTRCFGVSWAYGAVAVAVSATAGRLALTLAARVGVPAARPEGLGAAVAETVPVRGALLVLAAVVLAAAGAGAQAWPAGPVRGGCAVLAACAAAEALRRHCARRFGGVSGDVFGALAETAATTALVVMTFGAPH